MKILSITFHCPEELLPRWEVYSQDQLALMIDNLFDVEKHVFSEVYSENIREGKNFNLLLIFRNEELRDDFLEIEMKNLEERIFKEFGQEIMIFQTLLNPSKIKLD